MAEIQYVLNGVPCNPTNREEINYVLDFSSRRFRELELSVDSLRFVAEDYDDIKTWRDTYGDYVGMPLSITYSNGLTKDYMLDFSDSATSFKGRSCNVKLIKVRDTDNFFDNLEFA